VIPHFSPPSFVDMTGQTVAGCRVLHRVKHELAACAEWDCECIDVLCKERFRMQGVHLRKYERDGKVACPKCRKRLHLERLCAAQQKRRALEAKAPPERHRGHGRGEPGKVSMRNLHAQLAARLQRELGPAPCGEEWRRGFARACLVVEQVLDVRVLEDGQ
jgi:hypothetical protein